MKTCVEIAETVARRMGRASLVSDYRGGDFTPTPLFLGLINDAHHWLDLHHRPDQPLDRVDVPMAPGDHLVSVPRLKHVHRIDIEDGGRRYELDRVDLAQLRRMFPQPWADLPRARPQFWARAVGEQVVEPSGIPVADTEIDLTALGLPQQAQEDYGWYVYGLTDTFAVVLNPDVWTVKDGVATWDGERALYVGDDAIHAGQHVLIFVSFDEEQPIQFDYRVQGSPVGLLRYEPGGDTTQQLVGLGEVEMMSGPASAHVYPGWSGDINDTRDVEQVEVAGVEFALPGVRADIVTMLPAVDDITLHMFGSRYSPQMQANTDVTWWSDKHPNILQKAIRREVEMELNRNPTEAEKIALETRGLLRQVESNEVQERSSAEADDWRIMP